MPELSTEQYDALKADIEANGVMVAIVIDQYGRVLDGHNRKAIAAELGIDCPAEIRHVAGDDEAADVAVTLNCARRHLNREQTREIIGAEIDRRPDDSDRAIARRVGCDHKTVGTVRRQLRGGESPQPSHVSRAEAEMRAGKIQARLERLRNNVAELVVIAMSNAITPGEIVMALTQAQRAEEDRWSGEEQSVADMFRVAVFTPLIDYAMHPATFTRWRPQWDHETFLPLADEERRALLDGIAAIGGGVDD